jgi:hypothetical protein
MRRRDRAESRLDALEGRIAELTRAVERSGHEVEEANAAATRLRAQEDERSDAILERLGRLQSVLELVYYREPEMRERLGAVRRSAEYALAFEEREPLVSVVIPTYDRGDLLVTRAIPSALDQTYTNVEIVIVGDGAPDGTGRQIADLADGRIRYMNLSYRGPYPEDRRDFWHVAGVPARNAAVAWARGVWIAPLDDDDAFHPDHIAHLLGRAQRDQLEVVYGRLRCVMNDGTEFTLGAYPPTVGQFGWQGAMFHSGLGFFEMELADELFFSPADWALCRRMLRTGVRFGMVDEVVTDHYESRFAPQPTEYTERSVARAPARAAE